MLQIKRTKVAIRAVLGRRGSIRFNFNWQSGTLSKSQNMQVLLVGAGGIGCELLKCLILSEFLNVHLVGGSHLRVRYLKLMPQVDLDTIDVSNLNRQFLFRRHHVGQSKAEVNTLLLFRKRIQLVLQVAAKSALKFNPCAKITAYCSNIITDPRFDVAWFQSFDLVFNALDNLGTICNLTFNWLCIQVVRGSTACESHVFGCAETTN